jgi:signal transduction histidine kinase
MWRKFVEWHREWEHQQLAVLETPSLALEVPPGYRRYCANKLAGLSDIERMQLRQFLMANKGRRGYFALAKLALAFTVVAILLYFASGAKLGLGGLIVVTNMVGFGICMGLAGAWFNYRRAATRQFSLFIRAVIGSVAGVFAGYLSIHWLGDAAAVKLLERLPQLLAWGILVSGVLVAIPMIVTSWLRNRYADALAVQLQQDAERERLARELSESQLRLLRAQIEPHFLFNTLGAVQQLAQHGAPRAAEMTANLIAFLRASLAEMRCEEVALGTDFRLVEAYLRVMQMRLGERLRHTLSLPDRLAGIKVPSMLLLTLVENAIKHGIEPSLRGGEVHVAAEEHDGFIRIRVSDSGVGMSAAPGAGTGLDNVRRRLQLAYGDNAVLVLREADPGFVAEVSIPHREVPA